MHRLFIFVLIIFLIYHVKGNNENQSPNERININNDIFASSDDSEIITNKYRIEKKLLTKRSAKECDKTYKGNGKPYRKNQLNIDDGQPYEMPTRHNNQYGVINLPGGKFTCECKWTPEDTFETILNIVKPLAARGTPHVPSRRTGYQPIRLQERTYDAHHLKYDDE